MLYRYRSADTLLNRKELEEQYFYFATPSQQNDPMEGFVNYVWSGDVIAWIGFFKNYTWQLYLTISAAMLDTPIERLEELFFDPLDTNRHNPISIKRKELEHIIENDSKIAQISKILGSLSNPINRTFLLCVCVSFHQHILKIVERYYLEQGIHIFGEYNYSGYSSDLLDNYLKAIEDASKNHERDIKIISDALNPLFHNVELSVAEKNILNKNAKTTNFILFNFPSVFINGLSKLTFPKSYSVSFSDDIANPALWGYYANGHKGVALLFDFDTNGIANLFFKNQENNDKFTNYNLEVKKVNYSSETLEINFFETLGRLNGSELTHWMICQEQYSKMYNKSLLGNEELIQNYWATNEKRLLHKSRGWELEREYRIIISDILDVHHQNEQRKMYYSFDDLKGIIFGINTNVQDKIKIIRIIKQKCIEQNRKNFDYFQAVFDSDTGTIKTEKVHI